MVMEIYHLAMNAHEKTWTVSSTAAYFSVSIGLVSENLKLANSFHTNPALMQSPNRQEALKRLNGNGTPRHNTTNNDG